MHNSISEKLLQQFNYFTNLIHRGRQQQSFGAHEINLGRGQGHLLGVLITNDGLTQKELSTQLRIRPTSLGELVSKLEQSNYVERRVNENDKRVSNVYITEEGRKIVNEIMKERQVMVNNMFISLSEDEKQQLLALMGKLITTMEENMDDNDNEEYENNKDQRIDRGNDSI
ncbi:MarR family winged helix-turn-helix transcriptional regulator [Clostridium estertheticum]|uniref:MarR family winged helix-turn-helix transcriptional regulator n=1 Tax=Clostridium estertheticum TaxID=238834 RepID=UPI001C0CB446|nr:MarR family transcriptional regulator [Clostridium estertheticum]MBU3071888.1 MarR family transcriptional regulator [Clostridium estertheticum]MBU3161980.1 MarR family transcriptional regulator [Clostridium estertheticum]